MAQERTPAPARARGDRHRRSGRPREQRRPHGRFGSHPDANDLDRQRQCSLEKAIDIFLHSNLRDYPRFAKGAHAAADAVLYRNARHVFSLRKVKAGGSAKGRAPTLPPPKSGLDAV